MALDDDIRKDEEDFAFKERSETGEVMDSLDNDKPDTRGQSPIDLNTRLNPLQIKLMSVADEIKEHGINPRQRLTNKIKRLSVSEMGRGREDKVRIATGMLERQKSGGIGGFLKGLIQRRPE